jgi:hypothetical protein
MRLNVGGLFATAADWPAQTHRPPAGMAEAWQEDMTFSAGRERHVRVVAVERELVVLAVQMVLRQFGHVPVVHDHRTLVLPGFLLVQRTLPKSRTLTAIAAMLFLLTSFARDHWLGVRKLHTLFTQRPRAIARRVDEVAPGGCCVEPTRRGVDGRAAHRRPGAAQPCCQLFHNQMPAFDCFRTMTFGYGTDVRRSG